MRILLTNDDGIFAPGLQALRSELRELGEVLVVAPATEQSGTGHSVTYHAPLMCQQVRDKNDELIGWAVEGRPADCVKLALLGLLPESPDLVVSGINSGANVGINVIYSGTVAAAIEGAFFRRTSIAVSLDKKQDSPLKPAEFERAARLARELIEQLVQSGLHTGSLLNINIPNLVPEQVKGILVVPQDITPLTEYYDKRLSPRGQTYFWSMPGYGIPNPNPNSDVVALSRGYVTITPLNFDLTKWDDLGSVEALASNLRLPAARTRPDLDAGGSAGGPAAAPAGDDA